MTGKSLAKPSNFLARIGTPMKQLIEACGSLPEDTGKIIGGGPMMGKALVNTDVPTAKGSSGILIMKREGSQARRGTALYPLCQVRGSLPDGVGAVAGYRFGPRRF